MKIWSSRPAWPNQHQQSIHSELSHCSLSLPAAPTLTAVHQVVLNLTASLCLSVSASHNLSVCIAAFCLSLPLAAVCLSACVLMLQLTGRPEEGLPKLIDSTNSTVMPPSAHLQQSCQMLLSSYSLWARSTLELQSVGSQHSRATVCGLAAL